MSLYDVTFDLVMRVNDPTNGICLNENISKVADELTEKVKEDYPNCVVLPRGFNIVNEGGFDG